MTVRPVPLPSQSSGAAPTGRAVQPPKKILSRFQSGHGWTGGADDTSVKALGSQSYRITTTGNNTYVYLDSGTFTAVDMSPRAIRLLTQQDGSLSNFDVLLYQGSNIVSASPDTISGEFGWTTFPRSAFSLIGGAGPFDYTAVTKFQIRVKDPGGGASGVRNVWYQAVELVPDESATYPNGVFVLEADDMFASQKSLLLPLADSLGVPITFNPIVERVTNGAGGWSIADMQAAQRTGHIFGCHAYAQANHDAHSGPTYGWIDAATLDADIVNIQNWLHANGLHAGADCFALNPATNSPVIEGALLEVLRRRCTSVRRNAGSWEFSRSSDPYKMRSRLYTGESVAQLEAIIDKCAGAGGMFNLAIHEVLAGSTNGTASSLPAIAVANLSTVLTYAAGKGMVFRTRPDALAVR